MKYKEEIPHLLPYRPKLELAEIGKGKVNKYSFIRLDKNFYSAPEYLVDKEVTVKTYYDQIVVFANNHYVCEHKKIYGANEISIKAVCQLLIECCQSPLKTIPSIAVRSDLDIGAQTRLQTSK